MNCFFILIFRSFFYVNGNIKETMFARQQFYNSDGEIDFLQVYVAATVFYIRVVVTIIEDERCV